MDYLQEVGDALYRYFFILIFYVENTRNFISTNFFVLESTAKLNNYVNLHTLKNQLLDYEDSLKPYNRISLLVALYAFFYILSKICGLICFTWNNISKYTQKIITK